MVVLSMAWLVGASEVLVARRVVVQVRAIRVVGPLGGMLVVIIVLLGGSVRREVRSVVEGVVQLAVGLVSASIIVLVMGVQAMALSGGVVVLLWRAMSSIEAVGVVVAIVAELWVRGVVDWGLVFHRSVGVSSVHIIVSVVVSNAVVVVPVAVSVVVAAVGHAVVPVLL